MRALPFSTLLMAGAWLIASSACSQPKLASSSTPVRLGSGTTYVVKKVTWKLEYELKLVFFDAKECSLKVVANLEAKSAKKLEDMAHEMKAIAACNGGYFVPRTLQPVGLEIAGGKHTNSYDHVNLPFGGAFTVEGDRAGLIRDDEFVDHAEITDLVQCCPRLLESGAAVKGIGGGSPATRTFLLTDNAGHWALGVSNSIGLQDLADLLATRGVITEFTVQRALNLDGGPSSALWCRNVDGKVNYQKESWPVRNMLLLLSRKK